MNYSAYDREMLGILHALRTWRHYLSGVHFEVHTDHNTLRHITTQPSLSQRQAKWVDFLSEFNFDIKYMKGKENNDSNNNSYFTFQEQNPSEDMPKRQCQLNAGCHCAMKIATHISIMVAMSRRSCHAVINTRRATTSATAR